ncbi:hypothetical protein O3M35_011569 [Rhynocoris fuscipes]|uniref:Uncharacterized protein n=1 Tax=Rhynocoris fuscipes TaxID=488301 RepID=A0AAW1CX29_9HEMI
MFALIWRFSYYNNIWSQLCHFLVPVINEFYWNIEQQISLQVGHLDLNIYNIRNVFPKWQEFLSLFDNELGERLNSLLPIPIDFELIAIDILTCCPSINFQIAFDFVKGYNITNDNYGIFNIYAFFKLNNLKTFCQIPNVHNVELSHQKKQYQLVKFLREIVQWENMIHLRDAADNISNLEMKLVLVWEDPRREKLIKEIQDTYVNIQLIPYEPILKRTKIIYINDERHWNEYYCRFSSCNESMTGVRCIIDIKNKKIENLPLMYSILCGDIKNTLFNIVSSNDMITFNDLELNKKLIPCNSNNESSILQLLILYKERLNSSPGQAIINVCYDESNACQVTLKIIESQPFA